MAETKKRNGTIDFLKFVCCLMIVYLHSKEVLPEFVTDAIKFMPYRGGLATEFFFLVSGYLMVCTVEKMLNNNNDLSTGKATSIFIGRKIKTIYPTLLVAVIISLIVTELSKTTVTLFSFGKDVMDAMWSSLLLGDLGFGNFNAELWYLSSMIVVLAIYFPICYKHFDTFTRVIAPLIGVLIIGWLMKTTGSLLKPGAFIVIANKSMFRAFAEIALGASLYPLINYLRNINFTKFSKVLFSLAQFVIWGALIVFMIFYKKDTFDALAVLLMMVSVALAFSHQSILANFMDNKFSYWLGNISLTLYVSNRWVGVAISRYYERYVDAGLYGFGVDYQADLIKLMPIYLAGTAIATMLVYLISKIIKENSNKLKSLFVK